MIQVGVEFISNAVPPLVSLLASFSHPQVFFSGDTTLSASCIAGWSTSRKVRIQGSTKAICRERSIYTDPSERHAGTEL